MNDCISIIVPVYKVDKYLDKCVDSLRHQLYDNVEIILVDDGSPDSCPIMCDEYAKQDNRVKVIHQANKGLSCARNAGLSIATGDYIIFVDADDFIKPNMITHMHNVAEKHQADLVICTFVPFSNEQQIEELVSFEHNNESDMMVGMYNSSDLLEELMCDTLSWDIGNVVVWNKLYKHELINRIRFKEGQPHEDEYYMQEVYLKTKLAVYINEKLYCYRQRNDSIMGKIYITKFFQVKRMQVLADRVSFLMENKVETRLIECAIIRLMNALKKSYMDYEDSKSRHEVIDMFKKAYITFEVEKHIKGRDYFSNKLFYLSPKFYAIYVERKSQTKGNGRGGKL